MKFTPFRLTLLFVFLIFFASCDWLDTEDEDLSTNPYFSSLKFAAIDDEDAALSSAVFSLELDADYPDSIIVNLDSLPYQTDISNVKATFTFNSTSTTHLYETDSVGGIDTILISATSNVDTIDFRFGVAVHNVAADGEHETSYKVKVNVHKVESELYVYNKLVNSIYNHSGSLQKAVWFRDSVFFFVGSGINNTLYKSKDGEHWNAGANVADLPDYTVIRNILKFKDKLYYSHQDSLLFVSGNGINWERKSFSTENYDIINLLFEMEDKLWAISKSKTDSKYKFAFTADGINWNISTDVPDRFPIGDFAAHSFSSRTKQPKAIVVGGYSADQSLLNNIWTTENGTYWIDFSTEETNLLSLAGASVISYDDKLLMIGLMGEDGNVADDWLLESIDEGLSWSVPDTTYNQLRQVIITPRDTTFDTTYVYMEPRYLTSAIVNNNKEIIIVGGRNRSTIFKDAWKGKLNRLNFKRQ
jgi:hypothetical protein